MQELEIYCPKCHSKNVQKFSVIYKQNTSSSTHTTFGIGLSSGGNVGIGGAETVSSSITELGKDVSPPEKSDNSYGCLGCLGYIVVATVLILINLFNKFGDTFFYISSFIAICIIIYFVHKAKKDQEKWNREVYPKLLDKWKHSYMCMKCGHRFILR